MATGSGRAKWQGSQRALEVQLEGAVTMEQAAEIAAVMVALMRVGGGADLQVWNLASSQWGAGAGQEL